MDAFLRIKSAAGASEKSVHLRSTPLTIGRHASNVLVLDESQASRFHCVIERDVKTYTLRDLQSRNGTTVNGARIMRAELKHGDVIGIGAVEMTVIMPDAKPPAIAAHRKPPTLPIPQAGEAAVDDLEVVEENRRPRLRAQNPPPGRQRPPGKRLRSQRHHPHQHPAASPCTRPAPAPARPTCSCASPC